MRYGLRVLIALFVICSFYVISNAQFNYGHNTRQFVKLGKTYGVVGTISMTSPNINAGGSGYGIYQRVAVSPYYSILGTPPAVGGAFVEIGWTYGITWPWPYPVSYPTHAWLIAYKKDGFNPVNIWLGNIAPQTRTYAIRSRPATLSFPAHWELSIDNIIKERISTSAVGFAIANASMAGGEAISSTEAMGFVWYTNLKWHKKKLDGTYIDKLWATSEQGLYHNGYTCNVTSSAAPVSYYCYHIIYG